LVSFVDKESEKVLKQRLSNILPSSSFLGEESGSDGIQDSEFLWIVDPLDGTTNYLHGLPVFSISVALLKNGEPIVGVVDCPVLKETFTAYSGGGAHLNGEPISVAMNKRLSDTLIATGFPYYKFDRMDAYLEVLADLMQSTHGLRRMGSAAIDLAYTACGRFDGFFEMNLSPWDVAAGVLLVREAGGKVTDFQGNSSVIFNKEILAASESIYFQFFDAVRLKLSE
jgi:myo-inositol-1(or 4)-monophosphatase